MAGYKLCKPRPGQRDVCLSAAPMLSLPVLSASEVAQTPF